jgi:hypothetical protein
VSATSAGHAPIPRAPIAAKSGTITASSARPGMVWIALAAPSRAGSSARRRCTAMPSGIAISAAAQSAASESARCAER